MLHHSATVQELGGRLLSTLALETPLPLFVLQLVSHQLLFFLYSYRSLCTPGHLKGITSGREAAASRDIVHIVSENSTH